MRFVDVKRIALYYKAIPGMLHLLRQERANELSRALSSLSRRDYLLFYRKYYYRQSTAQIAAELGTTERAVEGRLYRIKKALRKALGGDDA